MTQKIIQIGNSTGIIIPKALLDMLGLKPGSEVSVERDTQTDALVIQNSNNSNKASSVSTHFLNVLEKVNNEYRGVLRELAQK